MVISTQVPFTASVVPSRFWLVDHGAVGVNQLLIQFAYLQLLDLMTTIAFLVNGVREGNPLVRVVIEWAPNPIGGLLIVKIAALLLGLYCWRVGRARVLTRMNLFFAVVVAWNIAALIVGSLGNAS